MKKVCFSNFIIAFTILFSWLFTSCENMDEITETRSQNAKLEVISNIVKLADDSVNIAGYVEVSTSVSQLSLKWNIPSGCNIDTTLNSFITNSGRCKIPIKWMKRNADSLYAPKSIAFDGGLLISAENKSQYVHLIWADKIDSTQIANEMNAMTRSGEQLPRAVMLELTPSVLNMDPVVGGGIYVDYSGAAVVAVDQASIAASTNIDKSIIPYILRQPDLIELKWIGNTPPNANFSTKMNFTAGGLVKTCYINYVVSQDVPAIWEFIDSTPSEGNTVLANEARIVVQVKTNKPWSLECDNGLTSPVSDFGTALENRSLVMHLSNNTSTDSREITVLVKSQGILQKTLVFTQMGQGQTGIFDFLSSDPVDKSTLPGETTSVDITVQSDVAWWIKCDCGKRMDYPASALGEKTGTVTVTENKTGAPRVVTVTVGYGDTTVKTLSFVQNVSGATDPSATLVYDSSNLPTGNIPQAGGTYTFKFTGTYTGDVQVRALINGVAQASGTPVTNKEAQVTVSANTLSTTCNVTFQFKRADGEWTILPTSTDRVQDAGNGGGGDAQTLTYVSSTLPTGNIPVAGSTYTFNFEGGYAGKLRVRAVDETTGTVLFNGPIGTTHSPKVTVPENTATTTRKIKFQYRLIDLPNAPWIDLPTTTNRVQDANNGGGGGGDGLYVVVTPTTVVNTLPAKNASRPFNIRGNITTPVEIFVVDNGTIIGSSSVIPVPEGVILDVPVEDNPGPKYRLISFSWTLDGEHWTSTPPAKQAAP